MTIFSWCECQAVKDRTSLRYLEKFGVMLKKINPTAGTYAHYALYCKCTCVHTIANTHTHVDVVVMLL